jgi:hypothetical protein
MEMMMLNAPPPLSDVFPSKLLWSILTRLKCLSLVKVISTNICSNRMIRLMGHAIAQAVSH